MRADGLVVPLLILLASSLLALFPSSVTRAGPTMEPARWGKDLDVLARELPRRHASPTFERPVAEFLADVERVRAGLTTMSRERIVVELVRLVASFGDSHTEVPLDQEALGLHRVPLGLYDFDDGLRVIAADRSHERLLGMRLVSVQEQPVASILEALGPLVSDDFGNPHEVRHAAPGLLTIPEILVGLDLARPGEPVRYTFERSGASPVTEALAGLTFDEWGKALVSRLHAGETGPLFTRHRDLWYTMERLDEPGLIYMRVSRCADQPGRESLAAFTKRLAKELRDRPARRAVIDLRQNTGGDAHKTEPLADAICQARSQGRIEQVYVVLGRHTYSAAILLAAQLRHGCQAVFVGEVPRAIPNHQGEVESLTLPNSGLLVTYSSSFHRPFPELGEAKEIPLDLPAAPTWASYEQGRDPSLEAILAR